MVKQLRRGDSGDAMFLCRRLEAAGLIPLLRVGGRFAQGSKSGPSFWLVKRSLMD